ncbi:ABC transporter substrate-binding protein [Trichocoleus sp. DQ-A2]|uniref:ABC transporter substrate-binding protein n=1 Tax=Cyanophyceae TaxID=3028117 RepID=UPI00168282EA|nr:ABC transporter substrate-binding protein [Coleofasciculus sp. FACHB-T130]MBD1901507.1 ABC transporter substrate-binding protein [Coleofasciculus sp. FACHB-125]
MSYCINPNCRNFNEPGNQSTCPDCGSESLVEGRYRVIQRLGKGGFGQTFEVEDVRREGIKKVLKILLTDYEKAICLFQREAEVLKKLNHQGIPKVEADGYFQLCHLKSEKPLHCLVMEKIEGINLKEWLSSRNHQPISQKQAIAWLKQLAEILQQVHQSNYFHRDIKPSNIMLRPDNQLVLIDFGAVREATETYLHKLAGRDGTAIISHGYTPPEQADGRAVSKSDFYALGRTFVHLLTGIHPHDLPENPQTGQLNWRNSAPQISLELATLINDLMAPFAGNRPENAQEIVQRLEEIETQINNHRRTRSPDDTLTLLPEGNCSDEEVTRSINSGNLRLVLIWVVSAILLTGLGIIIYALVKPPKACDSNLADNVSCGEEVLVPSLKGALKQKGVQKFASGQYAEAVGLLEKARSEQPSDPEILIYLNNARLMDKKEKAYTIAVAAPITNNPNRALEILRGAAQVQNEINQGQRISGKGLKVVIADDANNPAKAKQIAESLVLKKDILAVIGHYASEVTLGAIAIYQQHGLVLISPGSTSEDLSEWSQKSEHVFFRTVPSNRVNAQALASYMIQANQRTAAVFYSGTSNYSKSIRDQFHVSFPASRGRVRADFELCKKDFNAVEAINQAQAKGATTLVFLPDGQTCPFSFQNVLAVIKANQGRYPMVGAWAVYSSEILQIDPKYVVGRLVVTVPWHSLSSPNPTFPKESKQLWKAEVSGLTATTYDAARALITALAKKPQPNRSDVRQALSAPDFRANGAMGIISFRGGDPNEPIFTLVKVVPSNCSLYGFKFVPVDYPPDKLKEIERGCKN